MLKDCIVEQVMFTDAFVPFTVVDPRMLQSCPLYNFRSCFCVLSASWRLQKPLSFVGHNYNKGCP